MNIHRINKSPTLKKGKDGEIKMVEGIVSKVFKEDKKDEEIIKEFQFMQSAYELGIGVKPLSYHLSTSRGHKKCIVMEALDETLFDHLKKNKGKVKDDYQKQIIRILHILDKNKIFHGDISALNFMIKYKSKGKGKIYIIDFGMSKKMTDSFIKKHSKHANIKLGITVFILKIRELLPEFEPVLLKQEVFKYLEI
jgi:tRNA A-37 threonylcarbamoyl transferase component Bud32